jgi:hypothetical protein
MTTLKPSLDIVASRAIAAGTEALSRMSGATADRLPPEREP